MHLVVHDTKEKLQVFLQFPDLLWTCAIAQVAATTFTKQCYGQNKATECFRCAHLALQKAADCASTPQRKLTKDWILWSVFQTGQSKLFSHRAILLNSAPFLQLIAGITSIFLCYSILEIHTWSLFSLLKKPLQPDGEFTPWSIKAQTQIVIVTRSHTHYLGDIFFISGEAWHQVTSHFLHKIVRYSPVPLQFCCFWT